MRRTLRSAAVLLGSLALLAPAAPAHPAAAPDLDTILVKNTTIGGKHVRFVLGVAGSEKAFVTFKVRRNGQWRKLDTAQTDCNYWDGSSNPSIEVEKTVKQILVSWVGPNPDQDASEYAGFNLKAGKLDMYGSDGCPAAG
jgi:hypothetical protein